MLEKGSGRAGSGVGSSENTFLVVFSLSQDLPNSPLE